ncbi:DUF3800 domain-containing protein [Tabrizicola fusiformis]|uniref:DUF3800 domain-containing protein n=1 Tax=Tabrizicola sp. SY72 TaxID=2741673 RepID=UPI001573E4D6|nr:DUF3800 domain-containing protein [Tabrizicola sp. SY72]
MPGQRISKAKNKRIICFVDETGSAGDDQFSLGLVMAFAADVARVDKMFSDLLPVGFNEFHANRHDNDFVRTTIAAFQDRSADTSVMLFSHYKPDLREACKETTYAKSLIEAVKASTKKFRSSHKVGPQINNIDVIVDACEHNVGPIFQQRIASAIAEDGIFRGVNRVVPLDSSISRLIQLADAVAYMRHLSQTGAVPARELSNNLNITLF